ncbi:MAG TPA: DUF4838 domain-containing protein [Planctomycetota bacterium]|nr:DUF4838 domain-containing protein [Planctomycetota bacterium]
MSTRFRLSALFLVPAVASWAAAGTAIVVDPRPFPSVEAAAGGEAKVNWLDADLSDDAACTQAFAALELQHYLRKMSGRADDFPVLADPKAAEGDLIVVGAAAGKADPKLGPEGYRVTSRLADGRRVTTIEGGGRVGTLYGAYGLLYLLGCRWFAPGEVHEEIPSVKLDRLPDLDVTAKPSFVTRGFHAWEDRGSRDFLLWMARNRLNYWCVEQADRPLLHKLGIRMAAAAHTAQSLFLNPTSAYPYAHSKHKGNEGRPADPYPVGDQFQGDADKDGRLTCFEAHPEWFALEGGKRVPGIRNEFGTNFCSSNPHATTEFMTNFVQAIAEGRYRDAQVIRFWTLDGGKWCQCDACKALGIPTDRNLLLVNRLRQEVTKATAAGKINRPIAMEFLAYHDVLQPPTKPLPADFDYETCYATFYPIVRCYVHRFDDPACPTNARYAKQLHGWAADPARHFKGQLCIGEYYNVSGYKCLPICYMHTMANDIPHYYKVGARRFHYMHVTTANWGNKALTNYQMARQLWDVTTDCDKLWADYFARRYGPAAATMRRFYESLEQMLCNVSQLKYGLAGRLNGGAKDLFPNSHLRLRREPGVTCDGPTLEEIAAAAKSCRELITEAAAGADLPDRIKARIAEDEQLYTYGERTVLYYWHCALAFAAARAGKPDAARPHLAEATRLADLLRADTASTRHSSSHANDANALTASRAAGALAHIRKLLGPSR